ncbi:zinc finger protein 84-like isoform X2 [Bradysia coprophila]|uniref:zinc finger protein 84-like isoform X2 n=1 Tax=Bradysia coprophila TaxID=38358 RepID=UPI00187D810C|nr:zinc finger protein 84-like isoform X2 [Bradysia coprophila]
MTTSKMSDDEYDFDNLCRTCLAYSSDLQSIFEICASSTLPVQLDSLIMSITKVEINHDDGMPQKICNLCKTAVHQAYLYKLKCEESDSKLRKYFHKKVHNLNIKEELQDYGNLDQQDLSLADDPFQPSIEVDVNILNDGTDDRKESIKITTRHSSKNVSESSECTVCLKSFDAKTLAKHMKSHSAFKCETCDRTFAKQNHLNLHMQTHLKKEYHCDQCDDIFSNKKSLKTHEATVHLSSSHVKRKSVHQAYTKKVYEQKACHGSVQELSKYDDDLEEQYEIINGRYQCGKCDKSLVDRQTFRLHFRLHSGKNLKRCPICGTGFAKNNHLDRHVALHYGSTFKCDVCEEMFDQFKSYRLHTANHLSHDKSVQASKVLTNESNRNEKISRRLECQLCEKIFSKKSNLERHMKSHEKRDYPCNYCDDIFDNHKERRLHMIEHVHKGDVKRGRPTKQLKHNSTMHESAFCSGPNGEKYCECKLCDKSFSKISALHEHMDQHVNNIQTLADINFTEKLDLFDGLQFEATNQENDFLIRFVHDQLSNGHNGRFYQIVNSHAWELNLSDSETESESEMYNGMGKRFRMQHQCSKCDQIFDRSWKIFAHMKADHANDEFADKCTHCLRIYPNSVLLTKHLKRQCENPFKAFNCNLCGVRFMWKSSYDSHVDKMHATEMTKEKTKTFTCEICERTFFRAEHLERHKKIHIPAEKKFSCDLCKKKFNRKDNLKSHMRVHKEDKDKEDGDKHLCVYCGRSFSNSSNLIVHMRRHTGEKPCLCTICGKGFSRSNKLVRHMRIHTGIRPYKCTYCDRAFTQSNDLTLHIRRHTGDKPYVCGICGDRFIQGTALQTHRRLQGHFEENQPTPFASISVNNPNRYTNANRVNRIGTVGLNVDELIKQEKSTVNSGATMHEVQPSSSSPTSQLNRSATATAAYIPNGNPYLTIQNLDVTPMLAISHFQGYN